MTPFEAGMLAGCALTIVVALLVMLAILVREAVLLGIADAADDRDTRHWEGEPYHLPKSWVEWTRRDDRNLER